MDTSRMRRPCLFKKGDVTRAVKAVLATGLEIAQVEIGKDGGINLVLGKPEGQTAALSNNLDRELAEFNAQHG
jgi:hypothetical protein